MDSKDRITTSQKSANSKRNSSFDRGLQLLLDNESGEKILAKVAMRKEILKARTLFEASTQVASPSKDYCNIVVTKKGVVWRKWKITLRGLTSGRAPIPQPVEEFMTYTEYKFSDSIQVNSTFTSYTE